MSLHCELYINTERIGSVHATRIAGAGVADGDVNAYRASITGMDDAEIWRGQIWHRYGDGAWELVERVLRASRYPSIEVPTENLGGAA
ncbi:hypothetical protein ACIP5Y_21230 [Nocardia sp. NPDC088792]|uniref:hypothetical protein n=1 Tax=Nocardia sp. NPDC088792 TaxID=3364332 RepID=UPI0038107630